MANRWIIRNGEKVLQQIVYGQFDESWQDVQLREETALWEDEKNGPKVIQKHP